MRVNIAIIATILAVILWRMDSAATLKSNGYGLKSLPGWALRERQWRGVQYVNRTGSVHWEKM